MARAIVLALMALLASGCATMFNRSPGDVSIITVPEGADVKVDDLATSCQTPCELEVKPDRYELHISKPGYRPETVQLVKRMAVSFWFNFITGPYCVIGMGIDWLTDSMHKISPAEVKLKLVPLAGAKIEEKKKLKDEDEAEEDDGSGSDAAPPDKGPQSAPPPPKLEGDKIAPPLPQEALPAVEPPPPPPPPEPPPPPPDAYVDRQIDQYYGELSPKRRAAVRARLDKILKELRANGEQADIDDAVRIDKDRTAD